MRAKDLRRFVIGWNEYGYWHEIETIGQRRTDRVSAHVRQRLERAGRDATVKTRRAGR